MNNLLTCCLAPVLSGLLVVGANAADADEGPETLVYKTVDGISVEADVYASSGETPRPVVIWIHGGALLIGNRGSVPPQLVELCQEENYNLVSIDYRLAPETLLPGIVEDVDDAIRWAREKGPELFHADPDKLVVAGASAGGYLSLMSATLADPPPKAIVSYWGYGDILGEWTTAPNPNFGKGEAPTREEAFAGVGDKPITGTTREESGKRGGLFYYMKRFGKWTEIVTGKDPATSADELAAFCPEQHVTADHPPLLMLHGTADPDVPVSQSIAMHEALEKAGAPVELITVEGGGHGLWGGDREKIDQAFKRSLQFIREHLDDS